MAARMPISCCRDRTKCAAALLMPTELMKLLVKGNVVMEQPRHVVIVETFA